MPSTRSSTPSSDQEIEASIRRSYPLPEGVWGYLDWVTGVIRLNISSDEFRGSKRTRQFEVTLNHELFHAFQVCTTGYLYRLCTELLREITRIVSQASPQTDIFGVIENPPASSPRINELLAGIDRTNAEGISVRDLIEGYAYFAHSTLIEEELAASEYSVRLREAPAEEYRRAYRYSEERLQERAFAVFPLLCYLALLFRDPLDVFCKLHDLLPSDSRRGQPAFVRRVVRCLDRIPAEYLGIPTQDRQLYNLPNPFYDWSVQKIKQSIGSTLVHYAAAPKTIPNALQASLLRPIILNDFHQIEPHTYKTDSPHSLSELLILSVASFRILSTHPAGPHMLALSCSGEPVWTPSNTASGNFCLFQEASARMGGCEQTSWRRWRIAWRRSWVN